MGSESFYEFWRAKILADPADWEAALAFKSAWRRTGRFAEADPAFRAARRRFPDDVWVAHMASLYAFPQDELPALIARVRALAGTLPPGERAYLLGRMLRQAREYEAAAAAFAAAGTQAARDEEAAARAALRFTRLLAAAGSGGIEPAIAVINLDRSPDKLATLQREFARCQPPRFRVPGVDVPPLPGAALARLAGPDAKPGTLGCFLAHAAAWEEMGRRNLAHCLIVEDDVVPLFNLPKGWGVFNLPETFDICYVNDRMAPAPPPPAFATLPVRQALTAFPPWANAPGMDGYLLSAAGARKLLAWTARDGFAGDVDWRVLAYALRPGEADTLPPGHARDTLHGLHDFARPDPLDAHVLTPPLIRTVPVASDREDADRGDGT